ncbi:MAG: peptidase M23, partial [Fulvivirga sp.]|nr:peptidase M23 [Fulvivirga sp.]
EQIADFGAYEVNVHWPPHLHFQIIKDMKGSFGDFPGVVTKAEREQYLKLCPDPNYILNIKKLGLHVSE